MNPAAHADLAVLETRVDELEERQDSTRRKFDAHLTESTQVERAMAASLASIQLDVHVMRAAGATRTKLVVGLTLAVGAAIVTSMQWTLSHYLDDKLEERVAEYVRRAR